MIRKLSFILALAIIICNFASAQQRHKRGGGKHPDKEQMVKRQCDAMIKLLALDNKCAEEFTRTYLNYMNDVKKVKEKYPNIKHKKGENGETIPLLDNEIESNIKSSFARERALLDLKERYYGEYIKFLTPQQIDKMYKIGKKGSVSRGKQHMPHHNGKHNGYNGKMGARSNYGSGNPGRVM